MLANFLDPLRHGPELCERVLPTSSWRPMYDALVCGVDLPAGADRQIFIDTGLIHLMVVSGSHLVFIETLLWFLSARVRVWILGFYCFVVGWQAPVVRAFLRRGISWRVSERYGLTALQVEFATVVLALILYPPWLLSRSFLMSWMCALALSSPRLWRPHPEFEIALKCYVLMLPFCWGSPWSIAWNLLLAPAVGLILFPACLIAIVIPPFVPVCDRLWSLLMSVLHLGPSAPPLNIFLSAELLLWLPLCLHLALLVLEVRWRRAFAFSYS